MEVPVVFGPLLSAFLEFRANTLLERGSYRTPPNTTTWNCQSGNFQNVLIRHFRVWNEVAVPGLITDVKSFAQITERLWYFDKFEGNLDCTSITAGSRKLGLFRTLPLLFFLPDRLALNISEVQFETFYNLNCSHRLPYWTCTRENRFNVRKSHRTIDTYEQFLNETRMFSTLSNSIQNPTIPQIQALLNPFSPEVQEMIINLIPVELPMLAVYIISKKEGYVTPFHVDRHADPHVVLYVTLKGRSYFQSLFSSHMWVCERVLNESMQTGDEALFHEFSTSLTRPLQSAVVTSNDILIIPPWSTHQVLCEEDSLVLGFEFALQDLEQVTDEEEEELWMKRVDGFTRGWRESRRRGRASLNDAVAAMKTFFGGTVSHPDLPL